MRVLLRPPLLTVLFGIYLALYPGSLAVLALDRVPAWGTWVGGALIVLQGSICALWLVLNYGLRGWLAALTIALGSFAVEYIGVTTGVPFGAYVYTAALPPKLLGSVPLAIPFAWLLAVPASLGAARYLQRPGGAFAPATPLLALVGATMALLLDVVLEPVATLVTSYWIWREGSSYYGVPLANFAAWWATALVLISATLLLTRHVAQPAVAPHLPFWLYLLSLCMFSIVSLSHGYLAAAAIGALVLSYLLFRRIEGRLVRWVLSGERVIGGRRPFGPVADTDQTLG